MPPACHTPTIVTVGGNAYPTCPTRPTAATQTIARLPRRSVTKPGVCGEMRHTIYCRGAHACLSRRSATKPDVPRDVEREITVDNGN
ncbi:MAG: hypothetical protein IKA65_07955 [Lentisphaeria bacterium]|nr:hypothetical protein [Lentisphaeria bacterium]